MLDWLSTLNHEAKQVDMFSQRHRDTGRWFLETGEFKKWYDQDSCPSKNQRTLYCHGTQGAGKTVISAIVIDELRRRSRSDTICVAFFYCNFREPMTFHKVFCSLLRQLLGKNTSELKTLYDKRGSAPPTIDELSNLLVTIVSQPSKVFIIIDALDEGVNSEGFDEFFETISSIQATHDLRLLVTSRENPDIAGRFHQSPCLRISAHEADIANFVKKRLSGRRAFRGRQEVTLKIVSTITEAAQGM
jgi:Cdc6-like AAA superfamily ATPase